MIRDGRSSATQGNCISVALLMFSSSVYFKTVSLLKSEPAKEYVLNRLHLNVALGLVSTA
jgi:hypothetical protein